MAEEPRIVAKLRNWRKHICDVDGTYVIWGHIYDDTLNRFPDGHFIHTSRVQRVVGDLAYTKNNTYKLDGDPAGPEFNSSCFPEPVPEPDK